jgi:GDP-L-fucose synthase
MKPEDAIFVPGHRGMVGSALVHLLRQRGFKNLLLRTRQELDLCDQHAVRAFYAREKPAYVFVAAARVGGIMANASRPVEFLSENLRIELNLIDGAHEAGVAKLLFLGSSCIYPKLAPQPIHEDSLLTGSLEPTNEPYALAKICGVRLCQAYAKQHGARFISAMPTNLYGPEDNFDPETSHVLAALIGKFHRAKTDG